MSILEKYDLKAGKFIWPSGKRALTVDSTNPYSDNVVLTCLGSLDRGECIAFLRDMNECLEDEIMVTQDLLLIVLNICITGLITNTLM